MKKISVLILVLVLATSFWGCGEMNKDENNKQGEAKTYEKHLSDDYVLLASGKDKEGNVYELVGEEKDTPDGKRAKIGTIKNNEWQIKMTENSPFIKDGKCLVGYFYKTINYEEVDGSINDEKSAFYYVGNGCFFHFDTILNSNTGKFYSDNEDKKGVPIVLCKGKYYELIQHSDVSDDLNKIHKIYYKKDKNEMIQADDGNILLSRTDDSIPETTKYSLLNTATMKTKTIGLSEIDADITSEQDYLIYPISENMIARIYKPKEVYAPGAQPEGISHNGFYDISGKKKINLKKYSFSLDDTYDGTEDDEIVKQSLVFSGGKCSFDYENSSGVKYSITIDKNGKQLDAKKISVDK